MYCQMRSILFAAIHTIIITAAVLLTMGCDSNDPTYDWSDIEEVRISPDSVSLPVGETVDFSFDLLSATGEVIEVDLNTRWESTDTSVFSVADDGLATAKAPGAAKCVIEVSNYPLAQTVRRGVTQIEASGNSAVLGFVGQDSARVVVF